MSPTCILFTIVFLFLTACGSSSKSSDIDEKNETLPIFGMWEKVDQDNESYSYISESEFIDLYTDLDFNCFFQDKSNIDSITQSSLTITNNNTEKLNLNWSVSNDILTITYPSFEYSVSYKRSSKNKDQLHICPDFDETVPPIVETPDPEKPNYQSYPIIGNWEFGYSKNENIYLFFTQSDLTQASYYEQYSCYSKQSKSIEHLSDINFKINNEIANYSYNSADDTILYRGITLRRSNINLGMINSCEDPSLTGSIQVELEFSNLPSLVFINHQEANNNTREAYSLYIEFDMDSSGDTSVNDLVFEATYGFDNSKPDENISLSNLSASISHINSASDNSSSHTTILSPAFTVDVENNKMLFEINRSQHLALKNISEFTNLNIQTYYRDKDQSVQVDKFPSSGYTSSIDASSIVDEEGDVEGNFNSDIIVDMINISVKTTE